MQLISIAIYDDQAIPYWDSNELSRYIRGKLANDEMYYVFIDEVHYAISRDELKNPDDIRLYDLLDCKISRITMLIWVQITVSSQSISHIGRIQRGVPGNIKQKR